MERFQSDLDIYVSPLQVNVDPIIIWFGLSSLASLVLMQIVFFSLEEFTLQQNQMNKEFRLVRFATSLIGFHIGM